MSLERINTIMLWSVTILILFFVIGGAYGWKQETAILVVGILTTLFTGLAALFTGVAASAASKSAKASEEAANQWKQLKEADQIIEIIRRVVDGCNELVGIALVLNEKIFHMDGNSFRFDEVKLGQMDKFLSEEKPVILKRLKDISNCMHTERMVILMVLSDKPELSNEWDDRTSDVMRSYEEVKSSFKRNHAINLYNDHAKTRITSPELLMDAALKLRATCESTYKKFLK